MRSSQRHVAAISAILAILLAGCTKETPEALLTSAKEYMRKNDKQAAVIQLKNLLQKDPNIAEARFILAKALLESGDAVSAEKELRKALELKYPAEEVIPLLARSLVLVGEYQKVTTEFGNAVVQAPEGRAALQTAIGDAHLALGATAPARDAFAAALSAHPKYGPAVLGQARIFAVNRDLATALATVSSALEISPNDHQAWHFKGNVLSAQGEPEAALEAYRGAVAAKPDFVAGHSAVALLLVQQNKIGDAKKQLASMKRVAAGHPQTLYVQALVSLHDKDTVTARQAIQQQLKVAPDNLPGLMLAAAIEYEFKSLTQAEAYLSKVLSRAPEYIPARRLLVGGYLRSGQAAKALDALKPVLHMIDKDASMLALAGEVYIVNGDPKQAAGFFAKAAALDPGDSKKRTALASSRFATGDTDAALRDLAETAAANSDTHADLALIAAHMQRREYDKALGAIAALEKKQTGTPLPFNLRGLALLGKNDVVAARRSFERALEMDPAYFLAAANLARLDLADKKPDAARQRYESVLAKDPKHLQALMAIALLRANTGAPTDQVVALIRKAVSAHPSEPAPRLALIGYLAGKKDNKKAITAAQEAVAAIPNNTQILEAAGRVHEVAGETNQALSIYSKLIAIQPGSPQPYLRLAQAQVNANKKGDAIESLRKALTFKDDLIEAQRSIVVLHVEAGRTNDAVAMARQVQKQRPKQSVGYLLEGDAHVAKKNWAGAATAYRTGLNQAGSTDLAIRLHTALRVSGDGAGAEKFVATWLKDHSNDDAFRLHLAQVATARKDYATAAQHYIKVLDRQSNNAVVLNNLAWVAAQLKDPKAIDYAEKADKLAPNQPPIMDTLGVLLIEKGETTRGLEVLQKASALAPQAAGIRLNLAKALMKVGRKEAARKELDELAKLGNKFAGQADVARLRREL